MVLNVLSDVTSSTDLFCVFNVIILYVFYAICDMTYSKSRKPPSSLANSNLHNQCRFSHAVQPQNNFVKLRIMKKGVSPQLSSTNRQFTMKCSMLGKFNVWKTPCPEEGFAFDDDNNFK